MGQAPSDPTETLLRDFCAELADIDGTQGLSEEGFQGWIRKLLRVPPATRAAVAQELVVVCHVLRQKYGESSARGQGQCLALARMLIMSESEINAALQAAAPSGQRTRQTIGVAAPVFDPTEQRGPKGAWGLLNKK